MKFDLISVPIIPKTQLYKHHENYAFRINDKLDSKIAISKHKSYFKTFFYIKITDEELDQNIDTNEQKFESEKNIFKAEIIDFTNSIHEFNTPIDFLIPNDNAIFYYNLYNELILQDIETCMKDKKLDDAPFYCVPNLSLIKPYSTLPIDQTFKKIDNNIKTHFYTWETDEVPQNHNLDVEKIETKQGYKEIIKFLIKRVDELKIFDKHHKKIKFEEFISFLENEENIEVQKQNISNRGFVVNYTKKEDIKTVCCVSRSDYFSFLPMVAYHTKKGPWARCWIQYGYDPRKSYKNYVYQRLTKYKIENSVNFISQDEELEIIVKNNENKYITTKYTYEFGYFKPVFIAFVKKYFKKKKLNEIIVNDESSESYFEIL